MRILSWLIFGRFKSKTQITGLRYLLHTGVYLKVSMNHSYEDLRESNLLRVRELDFASVNFQLYTHSQ